MRCVYGTEVIDECPVVKLMLEYMEVIDFQVLSSYCQACPYSEINS